MATVIVYNCVWTRVNEYYDNVEFKYPNTWDINDTVGQIYKIQLVINDFEHISAWSREPLIPHWKQMGWKETWDKSCPWHFAFERNCNDGVDYIVIHDAEHQDNIKESCNKTNIIITDHKTHNIMNKTNIIRLTETQLHKLIKECVRKTLQESKKKDPMLQWFADFDKASKFRETMDYIKKGGRNPLRKSKTNNIKEGRMLNEYEDYVGDTYLGEPLGEIKDGEVREFARKMFIHVDNEIRNLQRKYSDDYELCDDLQDIGELCMMAKSSL